jgi:hypothetical protein
MLHSQRVHAAVERLQCLVGAAFESGRVVGLAVVVGDGAGAVLAAGNR